MKDENTHTEESAGSGGYSVIVDEGPMELDSTILYGKEITDAMDRAEAWRPLLGKELDDAIAASEAYHNRLIDPLVLLQELDKLQRYQNGVRFTPGNLRRGQLKTKDVMGVIERLMNKEEDSLRNRIEAHVEKMNAEAGSKEPDSTHSTVQLQKYGRGLRIPGPVEVLEIEESVLINGTVWATKTHYDACKELDKNREAEFYLMMYGKNTDNETV